MNSGKIAELDSQITPEGSGPPLSFRASDLARAMIFPAVLVGLVFLSQKTGLRDLAADRAQIESFLVRWGVWAPIGFILAYSILPLVFIPRALLALIGGFIFGWGSIAYTWTGAFIGESLAFLLAGTLVRPLIERTLLRREAPRRIVQWIRAEGFWAIVILRLTPFVPTDVINFGSGTAGVPYRAFVLGTLTGILPGCVLFSYFGQLFQGEAELLTALFVIPLFAFQILLGLAVAQWRFRIFPVRVSP